MFWAFKRSRVAYQIDEFLMCPPNLGGETNRGQGFSFFLRDEFIPGCKVGRKGREPQRKGREGAFELRNQGCQ